MFDKVKYEKLSRYCAYSERCRKEISDKCRKLELPPEEHNRYIALLEQDGFLSETRYVKTYIRSKTKRNWGPIKIQTALKAKGIAAEMFTPYLEELNKSVHIENIKGLIERKEKSAKGQTPSEKKQKLIRFLLSKGYAFDLIQEAFIP